MCSTNPVTYYDEATGSVDEDRAADIIYLDFSMLFDAVPLSTMAAKKAWTRWLNMVNKVDEKSGWTDKLKTAVDRSKSI